MKSVSIAILPHTSVDIRTKGLKTPPSNFIYQATANNNFLTEPTRVNSHAKTHGLFSLDHIDITFYLTKLFRNYINAHSQSIYSYLSKMLKSAVTYHPIKNDFQLGSSDSDEDFDTPFSNLLTINIGTRFGKHFLTLRDTSNNSILKTTL